MPNSSEKFALKDFHEYSIFELKIQVVLTIICKIKFVENFGTF